MFGRRPDLSTLRAIHARHPAAIPFENLDPLLGRSVSLDPDALQAKLVAGRRGGYCFEQNTLLKLVLDALGFTVTAFAARVVWMTPPDGPPNPRAHMVLKVEGEGVAHIADVGFGGHRLPRRNKGRQGRREIYTPLLRDMAGRLRTSGFAASCAPISSVSCFQLLKRLEPANPPHLMLCAQEPMVPANV